MTIIQSPTGAERIELEAVFNASPERVYHAWTDPAEFVAWFAIQDGKFGIARLDVRVGGAWQFGFTHSEPVFEGQYLDVVPNKRLSFTWCHIARDHDGKETRSPVSTVTVEMEQIGAQTSVRLSHEGASESGRAKIGRGWASAFSRFHSVMRKKPH